MKTKPVSAIEAMTQVDLEPGLTAAIDLLSAEFEFSKDNQYSNAAMAYLMARDLLVKKRSQIFG
jgi:hypothetical protein